jgi:hypothetical protein
MTETPDRVDEPATGSVDTLPPPPPVYTEPPHAHRPNRLYQAAAWVAIVAGVMFIVGAVFFTGFALGRHSGGDGGWRHHRGDNSQFERRGGPPMMQFPMMPGPGGPGSGPGFAPGGPGGPGAGGPGATATPAPRP